MKSTIASNSHAAVKVHPIDTNGRVIFDTEIDVFRDTKTKVASIREVLLPQLILLDLEASLKDFFGLGPSDGDVDSDLFISSDTKGADGVAGFAYCWDIAVSVSKQGELRKKKSVDVL